MRLGSTRELTTDGGTHRVPKAKEREGPSGARVLKEGSVEKDVMWPGSFHSAFHVRVFWVETMKNLSKSGSSLEDVYVSSTSSKKGAIPGLV